MIIEDSTAVICAFAIADGESADVDHPPAANGEDAIVAAACALHRKKIGARAFDSDVPV